MSLRRRVPVAILLVLVATASLGMSSGPSNPPPSGSSAPPGMGEPAGDPSTPRQEAEQSYALAYEEIGKAEKDLEDGKTKNAQKKFRRALERCEKAVQLDDHYHEAWNLLGFAARKLGDYEKAFKAYDRCLAIKPDYAPAREYLGEAWLDKGDAKQAQVQLMWLERLGAAEELKKLRARYDAWTAAHPVSALAPAAEPARPDSAATPVAQPARADSSGAPAGSSGP